MIQLLASRYQKHIAGSLIFVFYMSMVIPSYGMDSRKAGVNRYVTALHFDTKPTRPLFFYNSPGRKPVPFKKTIPASVEIGSAISKNEVITAPGKIDIDGPGQPEMASFKAAGTNDMVNLFTGDFSYNIDLMDVGGYAINLFYDGGIGMEQEAGWVGLGWNINPGNVNRNMRGVPDDFNGEDTLVQEQAMKPNKTWGVSFGGDIELVGIKETPFEPFSGSLGASLGISVNNYLGPALELGIKGGTQFSLTKNSSSEKAPWGASLGMNASLSSRSGLTLSPNVSLTAKLFKKDRDISTGVGLSTSYNSRTGIKALQLSGQMSYSYKIVENVDGVKMLSRDNRGSIGGTLLSSSISFTKPSYIPAMRSVMTNESYAGHFQLGTGMFGFYGSLELEGYSQKSEISSADKVQKKPMVGYLYYQKAAGNRNAVMDFTRFNDNEVTPRTPVISVPQYSYDVFSIQAQGTSGMIRPYRNDMGYVRDNYTVSKDKSLSIGADIGPPGHYGGNFNTVKTPTTSGEWQYGNKLRNTSGFTTSSGDQESVYFRSPGESSVLHPNQFDKIGGTDMVRFKLGGSDVSPTIEPVLQRMSPSNNLLGEVSLVSATTPAERKKRTQVVSFLTAEEASRIALDTMIKSYDGVNVMDENNNLRFETIHRVSSYRKKQHISQVNVAEPNGNLYVYGIPVYDSIVKDFSFTVGGVDPNAERVLFSPQEAGMSSQHLSSSATKDGFVQVTQTPAYAHSWLLSGLLSPDYVDITNDGITDDDLGNAVKFNYSRIKQGGLWAKHKWRTPLGTGSYANFNPGNRSETKDDKGIVSYGERESWYLHSIESKTMIALFTLEDRTDGKGATDEFGGVNASDNSLKRLKKISLYSKADLKKNGLTGAKAIKTVDFVYSYSLCQGTPDNPGGGGKLALDKITFSYNGQNRANKNQYVFSYGSATPSVENPLYAPNASDRWGNYKPVAANPPGMNNGDYSYTKQDKTTAGQYAAAWSLRKILLPSGGQIEVEYESDDYAYVQNRRAAVMMEVAGFGKNTSTITNQLYNISFGPGSTPLIEEHDYVFIKVPEPCANATEVFKKYLEGSSQLVFKLAVSMPKDMEYIMAYATIEPGGYGVYNASTIWVKLNRVDGMGPLSLTAIEYLREQLPGQAFRGYDVSESSGLKQIAEVLMGMLDGLKSAFKNIPKFLREQSLARSVIATKSFVRLNDPDGFKYGGGHRVKAVRLKDNWQAMTGQYTSVYGQEYDYTTKEVFNGITRTISSGVASYEPAIGGEENPFRSIIQVANDLPLGPTSYGAVEMPVMDAFFPAPGVGYSKVTVRAIKKNTDPTRKSRSGIGKQVTEFYTAKDYPVYYNHTSFDPSTDKQEHKSSLLAFFYKYAFDSRALSQGFIIATNDMHGKLKSQSSYAENDTVTRINYTENFYRNTGSKGLNEKFDFAHASLGGEVKEGNMGIDIELMTDTREFSVKSNSLEVQAQVDWIWPPPFPVWLPFVWFVGGNSENTYRAITTTKLISYHAVLDSVVAIDKGSQVSTKNLVYDAETGKVIVSRANNEFDKPVYAVNYPAYWAYSGMGLAYKNIDAIYENVNFLDGKIVSGNVPESIFESGDQLYLIDPGVEPPAGCAETMTSAATRMLWVVDKYKNNTSLTSTIHDYVFMDKGGNLCTRNGIKFRIVRSGKRNILGATVAGVTLMTNPVVPVASTRKLIINSTSKVVQASAIEFREKWQTDPGLIKRYRMTSGCGPMQEVLDCSGYLDRSINPYEVGLIGNHRAYRTLVFYGERMETDPTIATNLPQNGFLANFQLYWDFNVANNLVPATTNTKWVWNSQVTRYNAKGMELETRDALNIYTAAQYGFKQFLPVAIASNSRYGEMFNEGFEDTGFGSGQELELSLDDCADSKYLGFIGNKGGRIVNTDTLPFNAHTGKFAFRVNGTASQSPVSFPVYTKFFKVNTNQNDSFDIKFYKDTTKVLSDPGGNIDETYLYPSGLVLQPAEPGVGGMGVGFTTHVVHGTPPVIQGNVAEYVKKTSQYVEITTAASYSIRMWTRHDEAMPNVQDPINTGLFLTIRRLSGDIVGSASVNSIEDPAGNGSVFNFFLCPGIYKVEYMLTAVYETCPPASCQYNDFDHDQFYAYIYSCSAPGGCAVPSYKSLSTENGCIYTKPLAGIDSMRNPIFSIPADKKMVFSAWVREDCGDSQTGVPCTASTYANNEVQLQFNDGSNLLVTIKPAGAIIEGWQRYEGYFTAPAGATEMTMSLINNSPQPIYYDDIRIHPFNSNMKSYVYDPINLRLRAELDANNYASLYEYDEDGTLIRTKIETKEGIKTVTESRSAKQKNITTVQ